MKTWTEYLNRLVGVVIGFLVLATTIGDRVHVEKRRPTCACEEPTDDAPWW